MLLSKQNFFILFIMFFSIISSAKNVVYESKLPVGNVGLNSFLIVKDAEFEKMNTSATWQNDFKNYEVNNTVILSVEVKSNQFQAVDYNVNVKLEIKRWIWDNVLNKFKEEISYNTLNVEYKKSGVFKDKAIVQFKNAHKMEVKVVEINSLPVNANLNLSLTGIIEVERYYKLDIQQQIAINHNINYVNSRNELEVSWESIPGAEEYELEWTYVNNYSANGTQLSPQLIKLNKDVFRSNNTRISVKDISELNITNQVFRIPLIYEQGYILYRIRALGKFKDAPDRILSGKWSVDNDFLTVSDFKNFANNQNNFYYHSGHESTLNWQSSVTFIEEGKNKIAVSYADGTLRSRQQVSRLNSEDETVVGESIYDHQGRKAIDVIPAPTGQQKIQFVPNFNVNEQGTSYSRENFDVDTLNNCEIVAKPMSTVSGASNYYSASNPDKSFHNAYIPDAEKYPFIQTVYTNDNTGRVSAQSGIGSTHKIKSGHETKNYYGKPLQTEIDRMFGSEAGFAEHYQKNIVQDPNGQVTISYIDMRGNVVATALAGNVPNNVVKLSSLDSIKIKENLLQKDTIDGKILTKQFIGSDNLSKIYNQELLVSTTGERKLTYTLDPNRLVMTCSVGEQISSYCFDCVVNVELLIRDKCGNDLLLNDSVVYKGVTVGQELIDLIENGQVDSIVNCERQVLPEYKANLKANILKVGDYSIKKVLTVNKKMLDKYTDEYLKLSCHKTLDDFVQENLANLDTISCFLSCEQCEINLGAFDQYDINVNKDCSPCLTYTEYLEEKRVCKELCETEDITCESLLNTLILDVSPFGQYGDVLDNQLKVNTAIHKLSVFNPSNILPANTGNDGNWKNPYDFRKPENQRNFYYNQNGEKSIVKVYFDGQNYTPSIDTNGLLRSTNKIPGYYDVYPQYLNNVEDFILSWEEGNSWAYSLVKYHPEFEAYQFCEKMDYSNKFDAILSTSDSIGIFVTRCKNVFGYTESQIIENLFNPLGSNSSNAIDPYFSNDLSRNPLFNQNEYNAAKSMLADYLKNRTPNITISLSSLAYIYANCPDASINGTTCSSYLDCIQGITLSNFGEKEWEKYKMLYLSLKQKFRENKMKISSIKNNYYCGCIGNDKWSPFSGDRLYFYKNTNNFVSGLINRKSQFFNVKQPCNYRTFKIMQNKTPRSGTVNQNIESISTVQLQGNTCTDVNSTDDFLPLCEEDVEAKTNVMRKSAEIGVLDACGECPITLELTNFLNGIINTNNGLKSSYVNLACPPNKLREWTPLLQEKLNFNSLSNLQFQFVDTNTASTTYNAKITNGSQNCFVELKMFPSYSTQDLMTRQIVTGLNYKISDIKEICCVSYTSSPQLFSSDIGKTFKAWAKVNYKHSDSIVREIKIPIEGKTSCYILNQCEIEVCNLNRTGNDLLNLMNAMLLNYASENDTVPTSKLLATNLVLSNDSNPQLFAFISDSLKLNGPSFPNSPDSVKQWNWKAEVDGLELEINIDVRSLGNFFIKLRSETNFDFSAIYRIKTMEPIIDVDEIYNFKVLVEYYQGNNLLTHELKGKIDQFDIGTCKKYNYTGGQN